MSFCPFERILSTGIRLSSPSIMYSKHFLFYFVVITYSLASPIQQQTIHDSQSLTYRTLPIQEPCGTFPGNSDLYGFGIRLGVYLQWISSWLVQILSPNGVMATHDSNSIFVLAIVIALTTATAQNTIQPTEAYIMLLICFGYFFTVLSFLGVRVYWSHPAELSLFLQHIKPTREFWKNRAQDINRFWNNFTLWEVAPKRTMVAILLDLLKIMTLGITIGAASYIRHPAVSWSGVAWRSLVGSTLLGFNLWFWWSSFIPSWQDANDPSCYAQLYFFGRRSFGDETLTTFFKACSIILAVPIFSLLCMCFNVLLAIFRFANQFLCRHCCINLIETATHLSWDSLPVRVKQSIGVISTIMVGPFISLGPDTSAVLDIMLEDRTPNKFWTINKAELPPLTDLASGFLTLLSRGVEAPYENLRIKEKAEPPG